MIRIRHLGMVTALAALGAVAPNAMAAPCAGFTDVDSASPFCPSVEWIKNRGVTVGCTATEYCPDLSTTRLAMATFMKRLGDRLSPTILRVTDFLAIPPFNLDIPNPTPATRAPAANVCKSQPFTVETSPTNYPRKAVIAVDFAGQAPGPVQVFAIPTISTDGGASFVDVLTYGMSMSIGALAPGWTKAWQTIAQHATVNLVPGQTYIFAYLVQRDGEDDFNPAKVDLTDYRCSMTVSIFNDVP